MILMCKNNKVYNTETEEVYNFNLLPGMMQKNPNNETYKKWMSLRYSLTCNEIAMKIITDVFGTDDRDVIDKTTHALCLSDCYWIKEENEYLKFEDISPYFVDFYKGDGEYNGEAIPTLYINGVLSKKWLSNSYMHKEEDTPEIEAECYRLCKLCSFHSIDPIVTKNRIMFCNFTSPSFMSEQADMCGKIDTDNLSKQSIIDVFGLKGLQMLIMDAIVGNTDRHGGNFGWLRNADTGEYITMAPLYGFDRALDSKLDCDDLILEIIDIVKENEKYKKECCRIAKIISETNTNDIFKRRANTLLEYLNK